MKVISFFPKYILWHYSDALFDIFGIARNYFCAVSHFFSLRLLLNSFASPVHSILESDSYKNGKILSVIFHSLYFWILVIFGMAMRAIVILAALVGLSVLFLLTTVAYIFWLILPISMLVIGITAITLLIV